MSCVPTSPIVPVSVVVPFSFTPADVSDQARGNEYSAMIARLAPGATIDQPGVGDPARAVSSARVVAGEAAMKNARACIQIHGGMGYTWEMAPHYYLKRAWVLSTQFGSAEEHEERLAAGLVAA